MLGLQEGRSEDEGSGRHLPFRELSSPSFLLFPNTKEAKNCRDKLSQLATLVSLWMAEDLSVSDSSGDSEKTKHSWCVPISEAYLWSPTPDMWPSWGFTVIGLQ